MKIIVGIALGLGDIFTSGGAGKLIEPKDGGIDRFFAVYNFCVKSGEAFKIFCTAGYSSINPKIPEYRKVSLAEQLSVYLTLHHKGAVDSLISKALCWGTGYEILEGIRLAQGRFSNSDYEVTLVVASHWTHIPRVWLYSRRYIPTGWKIKLLVVNHRFSLYSQVREIPAFLIEAVRLLFTKK